MFERTPSADSPTAGGAGETREDLLSDPHCRYLLAFLRETDGPVTVEAASRYIVGEMTDAPADQVPENVQRRVQTWLHHGQLPALDALDVVDFDPERRTVELTEAVVVPSVDESLRGEGANPESN